MRGLKSRLCTSALLAGLAMAPVAKAQIVVGVGIGIQPVCSYGYYDYAPYACPPMGFMGRGTFTTASSWAWIRWRAGAVATAGAGTGLWQLEAEAIAAAAVTRPITATSPVVQQYALVALQQCALAQLEQFVQAARDPLPDTQQRPDVPLPHAQQLPMPAHRALPRAADIPAVAAVGMAANTSNL
jgi:hypothetical protein